MITKKQHKDIAMILKCSIEDETVRAGVVRQMGAYFKQQDPRFDEDRFQDDCFDMFVEVKDGKGKSRNGARKGLGV